MDPYQDFMSQVEELDNLDEFQMDLNNMSGVLPGAMSNFKSNWATIQLAYQVHAPWNGIQTIGVETSAVIVCFTKVHTNDRANAEDVYG